MKYLLTVDTQTGLVLAVSEIFEGNPQKPLDTAELKYIIETDIDPILYLNNRHYNFSSGAFEYHDTRPDDFHKWDYSVGAFVPDTEHAKSFFDAALKKRLYNFITDTSNFPEWKQANYNQRYTELAMKKLGDSITTEEQTELTNIESVIAWKNQLISETNAARASIQAATTVAEIRTIEQSITYTPPPFTL